MKVKHFLKIRLPTPYCVLLFFATIVSSCNDDWSDDYCDCKKGNDIGEWEEKDTMDINRIDSLGAFKVALDEWGKDEIRDINL